MKGLSSCAFIFSFILHSNLALAPASECEEVGVSIQNTATMEQCMSACIVTLKDACGSDKSV